jgi:cobaltochelatase CobN
MHLLAAQPGLVSDGSEAVDLGQTPADIVVLSAADTEIACLSAARERLDFMGESPPGLRLTNLLHLGHNMSVDLYVEGVAAGARLVVVRLLGGRGYWPYGVEQIAETCRRLSIPVAFLPGDAQPDPELQRLSTIPAEAAHRLWQYCVHGGIENAIHFLNFAATLIGKYREWREPVPVMPAGLYWPGISFPSLDAIRAHWIGNAPVAAVVFYRALVQAGNLAVIDALQAALRAQGLNPLPLFTASLKDPVAAAALSEIMNDAPPDVILNATGFAVSAPGTRAEGPFDAFDCPVIQTVFSGGNLEAWRAGTRGLGPRDIAMNVALPEVDGRLLAGAVSFKGLLKRDLETEADIVGHLPVPDRVEFAAALAAAWTKLRRTPPAERRIAIVLANYPNKDGRLGNGVGLDTPAGTVKLLEALVAAGYAAGGAPANGAALIERLKRGPTNDFTRLTEREISETLSAADYETFFAGLPDTVRAAVNGRWGVPRDDPHFLAGRGAFAIPAYRCGQVAIGLQPARGYNIDPAGSYHDPALVPPHGYLAFYAWLRQSFGAHAIVHMGKHGNLEWLPGKALALSRDCFPGAVFGPMPHLYPFIVNDPGEGTQAKRRAHAVIVDHLTPPLTRAESYGPLKDLEQLVDEYYEASGVDPRRLRILSGQILELSRRIGLDEDCGIAESDGEDGALAKLDNYLCELKEMQIRDGLHVFGVAPEGGQLADLLVALARVPRNRGEGDDQSLIRALAHDLGLGLAFDPLDCTLGDSWTGPRPRELDGAALWRTVGDTVERLEALARDLVAGTRAGNPDWTATAAVVGQIDETLRPAVAASGDAEISGILRGLDGRFVQPGPAGAPTRGRSDVLPTGRNFYSVDTRTVPTPAAWTLGWKSASLLIERHAQEHGAWPKAFAVTAWGTSNMRTGGDDIAQALALMGVRPTWDSASRRVTGFEIMPLSVLDRPRVDVTLRISGFFRDAFPALIDLFDSAVRAVAELDEPDAQNPLAAAVRREGADTAYRVFGSKPGAYGAGLQALIDERGWETDGDLARAYVAWGGYAYGAGAEGRAAHRLFEARLAAADGVVHNQDNREHDLLDSDDYYQFEGGITAAIRHLSGRRPAVYHADHSRPESPAIRTLEEEIARVVRARVVNPKWIAGVMRHGYKGAFEMAATVDYLFAFAATAHCVRDHHFDAVFDAYIGDAEVREFIAAANPDALREMSVRLVEAMERGLWRPRRNIAHTLLADLADTPKEATP